jgi:hypothetical protein
MFLVYEKAYLRERREKPFIRFHESSWVLVSIFRALYFD